MSAVKRDKKNAGIPLGTPMDENPEERNITEIKRSRVVKSIKSMKAPIFLKKNVIELKVFFISSIKFFISFIELLKESTVEDKPVKAAFDISARGAAWNRRINEAARESACLYVLLFNIKMVSSNFCKLNYFFSICV